jgi:vesicle-associated membrane protein 4
MSTRNETHSQVASEVDEVVGIMQGNIQKVMQRGETLDTLQDKTTNLQQSSSQFKRSANQVRKEMWWKDVKVKIILGALVAALLIIVIYAVSLR